MENKEWLKNITKLDLTVESNSFTFMIPKFKELGMLQVNLEEKSVTIIDEHVELYPEDYEDLIIMLNDYLMGDECETVDCQPEVDTKWRIKSEFSNLLTFIGYIEDGCFDTLNQDSFLKIGYYVGNIQRDVKELRVKLIQLEETINNL